MSESGSMNYVYILECSDKKTYIGCTKDLKDRISRHGKGKMQATIDRLPVELTAYFAFNNEKIAFKFDKYLKSGSGRTFTKNHFFYFVK